MKRISIASSLVSLTHQLGVFPLVRSLYRNISPARRRERRVNREFYRQLVAPGTLCFDIGANLGQTVEALLHARAIVVAVEPNPNCIPVLKNQFGRNGNLTIVPKAVGSEPGYADLHFDGTEPTASLRADWPYANAQTLCVEMTTLDRLIAEFGRPDFLKVDVEGFELPVFKALSQPIPLIYFEMHGSEGGVVTEILTRLAQIGQIEEVNVVDAANSHWLIDEWVPPGEIPTKLGDPLPEVANVIVRMKATQ